MKITTANIKNPDYSEKHEIYVGTHTGSFKKIDLTNESNPHKQINIQSINVLNKTSRVTALSWSDYKKTDEILIGRANKFVKVYNINDKQFTSNIEMIDGPIVGLCRYDGKIIATTETGKIQVFGGEETHVIDTKCDNITKSKQCRTNPKLIVTGGRERQNNLKVWNLEVGCDDKQNIFSSKNVKNDTLELEVPIWDTDVDFLSDSCLASCSRYGYVRVYDMRKQRRPILEYRNDKEQMAYTCLALNSNDNMIYVGSTTGIVRAFDTRRLKTIVHTYKGFTGSLSDIGIDDTGKYIFTASLDRFIRIYCAKSTILQYQCYVKSKPTKVLLKSISDEPPRLHTSATSDDDCVMLPNDNDDDADEDEEETITKTSTTVSKRFGKDKEFDDLFDKMPTVHDEIDENINNDSTQDPKRKRKSIVKKNTNEKNLKKKK